MLYLELGPVIPDNKGPFPQFVFMDQLREITVLYHINYTADFLERRCVNP